MYVNWDGRTFLSCQNDGVYIPFSTFGARQNTLNFLSPFQFFIFIKLRLTAEAKQEQTIPLLSYY